LQQLYKCSYNAANKRKKKNSTQTIPVLMNMIKVDIVKKLLFTEYNSQTFNHSIPYQTQKYYDVLHFKTVQVTKSLQISQVNSPRVERQIPDIGITACHAEDYNLKSKKRSQRERKKNKYNGEKAHMMTKTFPSQKP